jgi:hypothetical protein
MLFPSPHVSINLKLQRPSCILDPVLVLTPCGVSLARGLGGVIEVWIARELWHILDNIEFYQQHPELLLCMNLKKSTSHQQQRQDMIHALQAWNVTRSLTPPAKLNLYWIGDKPGESFLPNDENSALIYGWEYLAHALEQYVHLNHQQDQHLDFSQLLTQSFRETTALAAVLKSAFILTYQITEAYQAHLPPEICIALESWGIPCQQIDPLDPVARLERDNLLHWMNVAGVSKLLWVGLHLAVLHLVIPSASVFWIQQHLLQHSLASSQSHDSADLLKPVNVWEGTKGFWYWL